MATVAVDKVVTKQYVSVEDIIGEVEEGDTIELFDLFSGNVYIGKVGPHNKKNDSYLITT